jgi:hypothetical protein
MSRRRPKPPEPIVPDEREPEIEPEIDAVEPEPEPTPKATAKPSRPAPPPLGDEVAAAILLAHYPSRPAVTCALEYAEKPILVFRDGEGREISIARYDT